jgi:hypothetical protein
MSEEQLTALIPLASIIVSAVLTIASLSFAFFQASRKSAEDYTLSLLPRRLDAIELFWSLIFQRDSGGSLTDEQLERAIKASLWLPGDIRNGILEAVTSTPVDTSQLSRSRKQLLAVGGVEGLDRLQSKSIERMTQ